MPHVEPQMVEASPAGSTLSSASSSDYHLVAARIDRERSEIHVVERVV